MERKENSRHSFFASPRLGVQGLSVPGRKTPGSRPFLLVDPKHFRSLKRYSTGCLIFCDEFLTHNTSQIERVECLCVELPRLIELR